MFRLHRKFRSEYFIGDSFGIDNKFRILAENMYRNKLSDKRISLYYYNQTDRTDADTAFSFRTPEGMPMVCRCKPVRWARNNTTGIRSVFRIRLVLNNKFCGAGYLHEVYSAHLFLSSQRHSSRRRH